ncbi:MAG: ABC transporter ATP-binding protein [Bryobacteraceae bacterium]
MRFFRPMDLSEKYNILQSAMAASERVFKLIDTEPTIVSPAAAVPIPYEPGRIEFDHVWFAYRDEDWVLQDVSFCIEAFETIAVVGHTGAGKTTLTNLLLRFYDVQRGAIRVGKDIREYDLLSCAGCSVSFAGSLLFTGTIADNIRLGTKDIEDEQIAAAAEQVNEPLHRCAAGQVNTPCANGAAAIDRAETADQLCPGTRT